MAEQEKELRTAKIQRDLAMKGLERMNKFLDNLDEKRINIFDFECRMERVANYSKRFFEAQLTLEMNSESDDAIRDEFEEKFYTVSSNLQKRMEKIKLSASENPKQNARTVQYPSISLPKFQEEYTGTFSDTEIYLESEDLDMIRSTPVTNSDDQTERSHFVVCRHVDSILNFPPIVKESSRDLRNLYFCVRNNLECLKNLGVPVEHWDLILIPIISKKLDTTTWKEWVKCTIQNPENVSVSELLETISNQFQLLERLEMYKSEGVKIRKSAAPQCKICKKKHPIFKCWVFLNLSIEERIKKIKKLSLCQNCLKPGHRANNCTSSKCSKCKKSHNTLLHITRAETPVEDPSDDEVPDQVQLHCQKPIKTTKLPILPTAVLSIVGKNNEIYKCRALLSLGAMSNLITTSLCTKLNLPVTDKKYVLNSMGKHVQTEGYLPDVVLHSPVRKDTRIMASFLVIDKIAPNLPKSSFEVKEHEIPEHLDLADPNFNESGPIDILLGVSVACTLFADGQVKIPNSDLGFLNSKVGWIATGKFLHRGDYTLFVSFHTIVKPTLEGDLNSC